MTDTQYLAPATLDEAVSAFAAANGAARILAGGTDLLVQIQAGVVKPGLIVDVKKIGELTSVEETVDGGFIVGAAVSGAKLEKHLNFAKAWPGALEGLNLIGSTQVQGRASFGGNLCNGSPAADSVPGLVAAGAVATIQGPNGRREMPVEDFPSGPGKTNLAPGEIVVSFTFPPRPPHSGDAYLRMIPRTEMDIAVVGCGVNLTMDGDTCTAARVAWVRSHRPCAGCPTRKQRSSAPHWMTRPSRPPRQPAAWRAIPSTTSAAPSPTAPRLRACS